MRIPMPPQSFVGATPLRAPSEVTQQRDNGLMRGVEQAAAGASSLGAAVQQKSAENDAEAERAAARADAVSQAEADSDFQRRATARTVGDSASDSFTLDLTASPGSPEAEAKRAQGYFSTRGKDAFDSGPVLDGLENDRQQVAAEKFSNPGARARWLSRSGKTLADYHRQVEAHAAKEFDAAASDALAGKLDTTLQAIANDSDGSTTGRLAEDAEQSIRSLQKSKEGGDAAVEKWRRSVVETRINRLLSDGDVAHAEVQFEAANGALGVRADDVRSAINASKRAAAIHSFDVEAQKSVDGIIAKTTSPVGKPDIAAVDAAIRSLPVGPLRDETAKRMEHEKENAKQRWKEKVSTVAEVAGTAYEKAGSLSAIDPMVKSWLIDNANDEWVALRKRDRDDRDYRTRLREKRPGETEDSVQALIAMKADIDERADLYRGMSEAEFFSQPGLSGLTPPARKEVGNYWVGMRKRDPIHDAEFNRYVSDSMADDDKLKSLDKGNRESRNKYRARMNAFRLEHLKSNGNKEPDFAQREKMESDAKVEIVAERRWYGDKKAPAYMVDGAGPESGPVLGPSAKAKPSASPPKSNQALDWAKANPNDPRSAAILKKLGAR